MIRSISPVLKSGLSGLRRLAGEPAARADQACALTERRVGDRRRHGADYRHRDFRLRAAVQVAGVGIYDLDYATGSTYCSPELKAIAGLADDSADISLEQVTEQVHGEDRERVVRKLEAALDPAGDGVFEDEFRLLRQDGSLRWIKIRGQTFFAGQDHRRTVLGASGVVVDVTERKAVEVILRQQSEELKLALRVGNSGTFHWNAHTHEHRWCNEMLALYGLQREEFGGRDEDWLACLLPEDRPAAWTAVERSLKTGEYVAEFRIRRRSDGQIRWLSGRGRVSFDAEGPASMVGINVDITGQKQAEEAYRRESSRLQAILDYAPVLISIKDLEGRMMLANRAIYEQVDVPPPERFIGRTVFELFPAEVAEDLWANDRWVLENDAPVRVEESVHHKDGNWHTYLTVKFPVLDVLSRNPRCIGAISIDISEHKAAEAKIRELNAELESRVLERTAELQRANEALLRSNAELKRFAHATAHDLQTPLRAITSFAQILQRETKDLGNERVNEWCTLVVANAKRLRLLIQDLVSYTRLEAEGLPFEKVGLRTLFDEVLASLQVLIAETGAEVTCGDLPVLAVDRSQIAMVLQNLIENGIRYNDSGAPRVLVDCERRGEEWFFSVGDNGIGIDSRQHGRIFEIFQRLHAYHQIPGTGIGLALCRRVLERHGGRIWVESEPGKGSVFYFSLPAEGLTAGGAAGG